MPRELLELMQLDRAAQERFMAELILGLTTDARSFYDVPIKEAALGLKNVVEEIHRVSGYLSVFVEKGLTLDVQSSQMLSAIFSTLTPTLQRHVRLRVGLDC